MHPEWARWEWARWPCAHVAVEPDTAPGGFWLVAARVWARSDSLVRPMQRPVPDDYSRIDELLDAGDLDGARDLLAQAPASDEGYAVLRAKLAMYDGSLPPAAVMQRLIQLMRRD